MQTESDGTHPQRDLRTECSCGVMSYIGGWCFGCGKYRPSKPARRADDQSITDYREPANSLTLITYDDLDRLRTFTGRVTGAFTYVPDGSGDRQSKTIGGVGSTYAYSPTTRRLTSVTGGPDPPTYTYFGDGAVSEP